MTSLERALYRRRTMLFVIAAILFLGGAVTVAFVQIRHESDRADQLANEADLRGTAVSTLAGDVRALRSQIQAGGKTPVAPDPSKAVPSLPDRTAVPVPIPGPPGPPGDQGVPGEPGVAGPSASPGATGPSGRSGADSNVPGPAGSPGAAGVQGDPGPAGAAGRDGKDGTDGRDGTNGLPPAGWAYTDPLGQAYTCSPVDGFDASAPRYTCTADTVSVPTGSPARSGLLGFGLLAGTASYRRL